MSYILDALKRAERERKQGQVSVLDEIPTAPGKSEPKRRLPGWLPIVLAVVVLILLIYALLAWRHHGSKDAGIASAPTPPPPVQTVAVPAPAPALPPDTAQRGTPPPPPQAPAATIEDGGKIATLDDVYGGPPPDQQADQAPAQQMRPPGPPPGGDRGQMRRGPPPATPATVPPPGATAVDNTVAANEMAPPAGNDAAPPDNTAAANAAPDVTVPPPPTSAQDQIQQAPTEQRQLREMPENFRANFPAFTVDVHAYNSNPQRRFVLVGGKRYHEGDTLAEGPRIVGIVPEGLVLDWQGQQVLYAISH